LCVIRGAGIRLQIGNATALLLENSPPYTFAGEAPASSTLVAGMTVDLNVMSCRSRFHHAVKRLSIDAPLQLQAAASTTIVFCQSGSLECEANGTLVRLGAEDCIVFDAQTSIGLSAAESASAIVIELFEALAAP
jgi:environmental stress-induced protein Ves